MNIISVIVVIMVKRAIIVILKSLETQMPMKLHRPRDIPINPSTGFLNYNGFIKAPKGSRLPTLPVSLHTLECPGNSRSETGALAAKGSYLLNMGGRT